MSQETTESYVNRTLKEFPKEIRQKVIKDFSYWQGQEVTTSRINVNPVGEIELPAFTIVVVERLAFLDIGDYIDTYWGVRLSKRGKRLVQQELDEYKAISYMPDELDPYIRGFSYELGSGQYDCYATITDYYQGWK